VYALKRQAVGVPLQSERKETFWFSRNQKAKKKRDESPQAKKKPATEEKKLQPIFAKSNFQQDDTFVGQEVTDFQPSN